MDDEMVPFAVFDGQMMRVLGRVRAGEDIRVTDGFGRWAAASKGQRPAHVPAYRQSTEDAAPLD